MLFLALLLPQPLQEPIPADLGTTVVTPTLSPGDQLDAPYATHVVDQTELDAKGYRTLPQALRNIPGILVQETSHGQGSPYIRGFTGFRTLALVDGIRLNNSVFRPGPNQYWNTIDAFSIDSLEVVKGPSSVLYGSDAIGGTVNARTRSPWGHSDEPAISGEVRYRWADAANFDQSRIDLSATYGQDGGVLIGLTSKSFGDVHGGSQVGAQPGTGYDEFDGDLKLEHFLNPNTRITLAHQVVDQTDVPRTHKTTDGIDWEGLSSGSDLKRDFDQRRELTYFQTHMHGLDGLADEVRTSISWQTQAEDRDRIKSDGSQEFQGFVVGTLGLFAHFHKGTDTGRWTWGAEYYRDNVDSYLTKAAGNTAADDIQGPVADDATYDTLGIFVQNELPLSEKLGTILGVRWNLARADANSVRDPLTNTRISIDDSWDAVVGSARFLYELTPETTNLFGGISQGFRAPNLSDLSRFDSARSNEFELPAPDLDPEYYTNFELGVKRRDNSWSSQVVLFHTLIRDKILRFPTGNTNASGEREITKDNVGNGSVEGIELGLAYRMTEQWSTFGNATYLHGKQSTYPTSAPVLEDEYLDRLMPFTAQLGLRWEDKSNELWVEGLVAHAARGDRLSTRDVNDSTRIPAGGTPAFTTLDLRLGWQVLPNANLHLGLENLTDKDYRIHGSGLNRPGRNLTVGFGWSF
ncbi:MAG: TonB-dependent receptor [Planctomycetota bacterium]|nr:TonB-dependent receptor [Planctomycetota bacterium]